MNGIHDLGGLNCFGPVVKEEDEPVFHDHWEKRLFATMFLSGLASLDAARYAIERADPVNYLGKTYYERWLAGIELLVEEHNLEARPVAEQPTDEQQIEPLVFTGSPATREDPKYQPRFEVGAKVRALNTNTRGHTRLPRYAKGHTGVVNRIQGNHVLPDASAKGEDVAEPLYSVAFTHLELWGSSGAGGNIVYVDLWESYLESA
jgi:nitrile hydratase beta subunit